MARAREVGQGTGMTDALPTPRSVPHGYDVSAWCRACQHTVRLDPAGLVAGGHGDVPLIQLPLRLRPVWHHRRRSQRQEVATCSWLSPPRAPAMIAAAGSEAVAGHPHPPTRKVPLVGTSEGGYAGVLGGISHWSR